MNIELRRIAPDLSATEVVGERALAVGIDAAVVGACSVALAASHPTLAATPIPAAVALAALAWLTWLAYAVGFVGRWGQTPGKYLAGVVVVDVRGGAPTYRTATIREVLRVADVALVGLAPLWRTDRRQRLGDRIAGTIVVGAVREERRL